VARAASAGTIAKTHPRIRAMLLVSCVSVIDCDLSSLYFHGWYTRPITITTAKFNLESQFDSRYRY
jgi:hypothetical protein